MHTLRESANLKLVLVATAIMGASGRAILRALSMGERDGAVLAELAKGMLWHKRVQYVRLLRRRGAKKAALVVGHSILVAAYQIVRDGVPYHDLGPEHVDRLATERLTRHDVHRLEQLGHHVTLDPQVA